MSLLSFPAISSIGESGINAGDGWSAADQSAAMAHVTIGRTASPMERQLPCG